MSVYSRAIKHFDMGHVKELHEEKIKEEKIANIQEQQEKILAELKKKEMKEDLKFSNWRRDLKNLDEGMTTASLGMVNYPAEGNVDLGTAISSFTLSGAGAGGFNSTTTDISGDSTEFDTMVVTISTTSSEWVIEPGDTIIGLASGGSGSHTVVIPRTYSSLYFSSKNDGSFTASVTYQRRAPVNVFVSLDSPEANAFIRTDPSMQGLSAEDKKKKLIDMLDAGNEYLLKQLGMTGSSARPSDTTMPNSWEQAAGGATDAMSDDLYNWMWKTYSLPAAEWKKNNPTKPNNSNPFLPKGSYVPKASGSKDYGNIASADWPNANPSNNPLPIIPYDNPNQERMPGANPPIRPQNGGKFPFAKTNKNKNLWLLTMNQKEKFFQRRRDSSLQKILQVKSLDTMMANQHHLVSQYRNHQKQLMEDILT